MATKTQRQGEQNKLIGWLGLDQLDQSKERFMQKLA